MQMRAAALLACTVLRQHGARPTPAPKRKARPHDWSTLDRAEASKQLYAPSIGTSLLAPRLSYARATAGTDLKPWNTVVATPTKKKAAIRSSPPHSRSLPQSRRPSFRKKEKIRQNKETLQGDRRGLRRHPFFANHRAGGYSRYMHACIPPSALRRPTALPASQRCLSAPPWTSGPPPPRRRRPPLP